MDESYTGGDVIVQALKATGVEYVFGIISIHNIPIYEAIARQGGIRPITNRSEPGAVNMADGYAKATGRLGVVITSTGAGAGNAALPIAPAIAEVAAKNLRRSSRPFPAAKVSSDEPIRRLCMISSRRKCIPVAFCTANPALSLGSTLTGRGVCRLPPRLHRVRTLADLPL